MATPEIAMTIGGLSRRIAWKLCRDRKVRCGGEQPACEKCKRAGEECVYIPTQKPSKAELAQTVETLQKRLDEAEAYIVRLKTSSNCTTLTSPSALNFETPPNVITDNQLQQIGHVSSDVHDGPASNSVNVGNILDLLHNQQDLHTSGPGPREQSQPLADLQNLFPIDEYINIDSSSLDFYPQNGLGPQRGFDEATGAAILEPVTKFSSAIFQTQAETLVMASVVADYIAWLRKAPPGGGIPAGAESPVYLGMLDNLDPP
ncbi:hypothetical protein INS49_004051 [Diaporthe citri]|uniref:uncharacterized protein n=1 Tax=Diaporthe citri TaxID=83186 RepID=UPI001C7F7AC9|nr:uncharacterized protein INS49_004051 [Diaporthe citri]KAG6354970.1 hypothetical protein INS49_004051 [Diaporthe citri]